jgi:hypothetical protein
MKDLGSLQYILGIHVFEDTEAVYLNQGAYIDQILKWFGMENCKPISTPAAVDLKLVKEDSSKPVSQTDYQSMIGSLLYLAISTRPDISYSVGALSKFNACPTETHLTAVKRVFRCLQGTRQLMLKYSKVDSEVVGYCDASWGDNEDRHSTTGVVFLCANSPIVWFSKRQPTVAISTAEAEYIALFAATKEAIWILLKARLNKYK